MSFFESVINFIKELFLIENTQFIFFSVIIAAIGGIANWVMGGRYSFWNFVSAAFLGGFAGFLVGQVCLALNIEVSWTFFICGSAGLAGEVLLRVSRKWVISKMGKLISQDVQAELAALDREHEERKSKIIEKNVQTSLKDFLTPNDKRDDEKNKRNKQ